MSNQTKHIAGPAIHAVHPWIPGNPHGSVRHQLLSDDDRARLAKIATIVRFKKGELIYQENDPADSTYNIISGVVIAHRIVKDAEQVLSFLGAGDLFGLTEEGRYANSTSAATTVVAYKMPMAAVRRVLDNNAHLDVNVIIKLCEELRESQRHAVLLSQKRAVTRLAMFLDLQEHLQTARGEPTSEIHLPMDRSSISAYLGLTLAAVSRAFRTLVSRKIISCRNLHYVTVTNRADFNKLADMDSAEGHRPRQIASGDRHRAPGGNLRDRTT